MKKTLTALLLAALVLSTCVFASGSADTRNAQITYRDIKIILNGSELSPTDTDGGSTEPFIMDGSTYLPVRAISEALGLDVEWDGDSSTICLSSADGADSQTGGKHVVSLEPDTTIQGPLGYVVVTGSCRMFPYAENTYFSPENFCADNLLRVDRRFLVKTADGGSEYWLLVSAYDGGQINDGQFYPAMRMEQVWIREADVIPYTEETKSRLAYPVWVAEGTKDLYGAEVDTKGIYTLGRAEDGGVYISALGGVEHCVAPESIIYPDLATYGHSYLS